MVDVLTKKQRSYCMSRIKSKNTLPEILLRNKLKKEGLKGYKMNCNLPGKPDIIYPDKNLAIFIDGCFWHKCPQCFKKPDKNSKFWNNKIKNNMERDNKVNNTLKKMGWSVIRIWEHEIKNNPKKCITKIKRRLK